MLSLVKTQILDSFEKGPVRRSLFSNGAVSLFHQFEGMESCCVNLYFLAGSYFEQAPYHGIAHVLEHMLFRSERSQSILKEVEALGAHINAYTYKEYVCFELECAAHDLDKYLGKFLSLFFRAEFTSKDLALEKKVILQELREDKDDHETQAIEYIYKKNFDERLGHSVGGDMKRVRSFSVNDLNAYYRRFFRPERMILSVVSGSSGDNVENALLDQMKQRKDWSTRSKEVFRLRGKKKYCRLNHVRTRLVRSMESSLMVYSFDATSLGHKDYYTFLILDEFLFGGMSSVMFQELREKNAYVYGLSSALNAYTDAGNYLMIFQSQKKDEAKLKSKVESLLEKVALRQIDEITLSNIKDRIIKSWKLSFDDMLERNEYLAEFEMRARNDFSLQTQIKELLGIKSDDVQKVLKKIMTRPYSLVLMGKK